MVLCGNIDDIVFFSCLELMTLQIHSSEDGLSFVLCLLMNVMGLSVMGKIVYIVRDLSQKSRKVSDLKSSTNKNVTNDSETKWRDYQMLFQENKTDSFSQQMFMFIFLTRTFIFHLIIGFMFNHPLTQSLILIVMSVLMLGHLIVNRPLKEKLKLVNLIANEFILLLVNTSVLILSYLDALGLEFTEHRATLCNLIIIASLLSNTLSSIMLVCLVISVIIKLYKKLRASQNLLVGALDLFSQMNGQGEGYQASSSPVSIINKPIPDDMKLTVSSDIGALLNRPRKSLFQVFAPRSNNSRASAHVGESDSELLRSNMSSRRDLLSVKPQMPPPLSMQQIFEGKRGPFNFDSNRPQKSVDSSLNEKLSNSDDHLYPPNSPPERRRNLMTIRSSILSRQRGRSNFNRRTQI